VKKRICGSFDFIAYKLVRIRAQVKKRTAAPAMNQASPRSASVEQSGERVAPRAAAEAVGQPTARRPV